MLSGASRSVPRLSDGLLTRAASQLDYRPRDLPFSQTPQPSDRAVDPARLPAGLPAQSDRIRPVRSGIRRHPGASRLPFSSRTVPDRLFSDRPGRQNQPLWPCLSPLHQLTVANFEPTLSPVAFACYQRAAIKLIAVNVTVWGHRAGGDDRQRDDHSFSGTATAGRLQWDDHSGTTTAGQPQRDVHSGTTTAGRSQWDDHSGTATAGWPQRDGHGGTATAGRPRRDGHSGTTTAGRPQRDDHSGTTTAERPQRDGHSGTATAGRPQRDGHSGTATAGRPQWPPIMRGAGVRLRWAAHHTAALGAS